MTTILMDTRVLSAISARHSRSRAIRRQGAPLDEHGLAATEAFSARVKALGEKRCYAPVDMPGMA